MVRRDKEKEADLGMSNPRTPEDYIKLNGLIYRNFLAGRPYQSRIMRAIIFLIGLILFTPLVITLANLATAGGPFEIAINLTFNLVLAIPGAIIMYRVLRKKPE